VQLAFPDWPEVGDADPQRATTTRHAVFAAAAAAEALFVGTHYPTRPAGRVVADGAVWRFAPVDGDVIG
jgi:hypothetical protein